MLRVKRKDVKMCNIGSGAAAAGTEDGFGEGQAVAGTIISKFSSQPVTAVDNEDDEDSVSIISKQVAGCIIFHILVDFFTSTAINSILLLSCHLKKLLGKRVLLNISLGRCQQERKF